MGIALSFLSGKGGSGKTTLSLCIADMLSTCGIKTLFVDCDISTNGATYFFENRLSDWSNSGQFLTSFSDILYSENSDNVIKTITIKSNMDFIPFLADPFNQTIKNRINWDSPQLVTKIKKFIEWAKQSFEVVLLDCQAGYTDLLPLLLPMMDEDLFVLEADSISASAIRNLHLKIGQYLGTAKVYQIFNKASQEEYEIYSKIVGTFFTNIGTMLFDWKIRQIFSRGQIPNIDNTSQKFSFDLCEICRILFPHKSFSDRFKSLSIELERKKLKEREQVVEEKLLKLSQKDRNFFKTILVCFAPTVLLITLLSASFIFSEKQRVIFLGSNTFDHIIFAATIISSAICALSFLTIYEKNRENRFMRRKYERELQDIDYHLLNLKNAKEQVKKNKNRWAK